MGRLLIILMLGLGLSLKAQQMLPGQTGIEVQYGVFLKSPDQQSYILSAGLISYRNNGNYLFGTIEYNRKYFEYRSTDSPADIFLLNAGYSFYLFGDRSRNVNFNLGFAFTGGYEQLNKANELLHDGSQLTETENFVYGGLGNVSLESYLTANLVFLFECRWRYLQNTQLNPVQSTIGLGFRYNF
ncbi:conjugal transfer protein TraO [Chryseobacterium indologenes]|uniref:conjugal transfer protein TraO n=1 Tax=Chryseobacterium indologenes TaxID=253 RepID=UPI0016262EB2|nr:conjugal transfer protein TraO [Chryseobacterium indologenes]MBF6643946.1 conjugal transfer protein TraO [Chryseobacterium indologenes]MBU3046812.1 conjugal transfer protein TraO [Chryseobacterium indologenes]QQQ72327.1 conjugal transfer protein TraO [Chryseobacterium indologenes]